jgi:hypothetical protein
MYLDSFREELCGAFYCDGFPCLVRSRKRGVHAMFLSGWFGNNVGSAGPAILVDLLSKFQPVEMFL